MGHVARLTTSAAMLAALAACGSDSGSGAGTPTTRNFAADAGTAIEALDDGKTLTAQAGGGAAIDLNFGGGPTALTTAAFEVKKNANGELTFTVNGVEQVFDTADRFIEINGESFGYDINDQANGIFVSLFSNTGELDTVLDPNNPGYLQVWNYTTNQVNPGGADVRGYAVVGTETQGSALASLPSATYSGRARIDTYPAAGFVNSATSRSTVHGNLSMAADFGAATIFGSIGNLDGNGPGQPNAPIAGSIAMDQTAITGNGFAGTLSPDAAFLAATGVSGVNGSYAGTFYGPSANQLGGTMSLTGTQNGQAINGIGFFRGDQN